MSNQNANLSKLTLGTVQLGLSYGIANKTGKPSQKKAFDMLDTAVNIFLTVLIIIIKRYLNIIEGCTCKC